VGRAENTMKNVEVVNIHSISQGTIHDTQFFRRLSMALLGVEARATSGRTEPMATSTLRENVGRTARL
jgi:hypothetical protein